MCATQTDESDGEVLDDESNQPCEGDTTQVPNISKSSDRPKHSYLLYKLNLQLQEEMAVLHKKN